MYERSRKLVARARAFVGDDREDLDAAYPFLLERGEGARVWDLDGNEFIDFTLANGAIVLGYRRPEVDEAVIRQIREHGTVFTTQLTRLKIEWAERLLGSFPGAERVVSFKTGSDATDAAVRVARMASNRDLILTAGYHGWHDWHLNMFPRFRLPDERHVNFRYDLDLLRGLLARHEGQVAGVIVTPEPNFYDAAYFRELQAIVRHAGVFLILDEVASGFRYGFGGAQRRLGLEPDLTCLGKGLANGYSIAAVVGHNRLLEPACLKTHMWGTYNSELVGITASLATLNVVSRGDVPAVIEGHAVRFVTGLRALFEEFEVVADIFTHPQIFHIIWEDDVEGEEVIKACLAHGVLLSRCYEQMLSLAHDGPVVDEALARVRRALASRTRSDGVARPQPRSVSRRAIEARMAEEFDGDIRFSFYRDRS